MIGLIYLIGLGISFPIWDWAHKNSDKYDGNPNDVAAFILKIFLSIFWVVILPIVAFKYVHYLITGRE